MPYYVHTYIQINKLTSPIFNCVTPVSVSLATLARQLIRFHIMKTYNWRANEASKTIRTIENWGYLFVYMCGLLYVILYFDSHIFVFCGLPFPISSPISWIHIVQENLIVYPFVLGCFSMPQGTLRS